MPLIVTFSKPINPLSLTASQFEVVDVNTNYRISGTIAIAANAMSATFTPAEPLLPNTSYVFEVACCYMFALPPATPTWQETLAPAASLSSQLARPL